MKYPSRLVLVSVVLVVVTASCSRHRDAVETSTNVDTSTSAAPVPLPSEGTSPPESSLSTVESSSPTTNAQSSAAVCTKEALLPVVAELFPDNDRWNIVDVEIAECRGGYVRLFASADQSVCTIVSPCLENEQVFLQDVGGVWTYLDSGTGLSCDDPQSMSPAIVPACRALGSNLALQPPPTVLALPGRLPPVDATDEIKALFPTPVAANSGLDLVPEVFARLQASFAATGFAADVGFVSLVSTPMAGAEEVALVFEVRNREESGDDTTPGYDLAVVMESDQSGSWAVTSASRQTICRRGIAWNTDPPLCV